MTKELDQKLSSYFTLTERALKKITINKNVTLDAEKAALDFLTMAKNYYEDARHFQKKGDKLTALAAVSYAHAWLDAGARLNLFNVKGDLELFTVDEAWEQSSSP